MKENPSSLPVLKEIRVYPESQQVTVVLSDDTAQDFTGEVNFLSALSVARHSAQTDCFLDLVREDGTALSFQVPKGTPHETFDA